MNIRNALLLSVLGVGLGACLGPQQGSYDPDDRTSSALSGVPNFGSKSVCADNGPGVPRCFARVRVNADGVTPFASPTTPQGYGPSDIQSAYKIDPTLGSGMTVALVDAFDNPKAEADLAVYRSQYGLPACTTANGCFKKVNQSGKTTSLPQSNSGWAGEIALDLDMVSAACPKCKILLVEASDQTLGDFATAEKTAVALGATVISNSWGLAEASGDDESAYNSPGVGVFVSAGDSGYSVSFPANSQYVHAVGGTALTKSASTSRGWVESVWGSGSTSASNGGTGSGCSKIETKPSWQKDTGCKKRTVADVAAVADPNTGVAIYNTVDDGMGDTGWQVYGGTSAASPLVASIYAMTGHGGDNGAYAYANTGSFNDVTSGSDGSCGTSSATAYLCTGKAGYDGPTGNGTPIASSMKSGGTTCTPACTGKTCGSDGCGGTCGACTSTNTCSAAGKCVASTCTPACSGKTCGDDGCGGSCGTCAGSETCSTAGKCTTPTTSTCTHDMCNAGTKLKSTCDTCVTAICAEDPYCCKTKWDSVCTGEVSSICGEACN